MWQTLVDLLSSQGRSTRADYWKVVLGSWAALFLVGALAAGIAILIGHIAAGLGTELQRFYWILGALFVVVIPCVVWISVATTIRRLHDRDKSGWWAIPLVLIPSVLRIIVDLEIRADVAMGLPPAILDWVGIALGLWAFVELGLLAGTYGDNRFGPDTKGTTHLK